jgi:hypothetical protein
MHGRNVVEPMGSTVGEPHDIDFVVLVSAGPGEYVVEGGRGHLRFKGRAAAVGPGCEHVGPPATVCSGDLQLRLMASCPSGCGQGSLETAVLFSFSSGRARGGAAVVGEEPATGAGDLGVHGAATAGAAEFGARADAVHGLPRQGTSELVERHVEHPTVCKM